MPVYDNPERESRMYCTYIIPEILLKIDPGDSHLVRPQDHEQERSGAPVVSVSINV